METEEFAEETRNDRLRVWPAVVILLLQVIVFGLSISSGINNGLRFGFMMFGPAAGVVLFATWLLVASRLRWRHRLMLATAMLAFPVAVAPLVHSSMKLGLFLYGGPVSMLISVVGDRVAPGRVQPGAPTDPYVPTLEHTVPQIMDSLRACKLNGRCARGPAGIAGGGEGISSTSSCECGCGD